MQMPVEVILGHVGFDEDKDGTIKAAGLGWAEPHASPFGADQRGCYRLGAAIFNGIGFPYSVTSQL